LEKSATFCREVHKNKLTDGPVRHRVLRSVYEANHTLATFRRKNDVMGSVIKGALQRKTRRGRPAGVVQSPDGEGAADLAGSPLFHCAADVDDVVGNDAEANPTFHPVIAFVAATVKPMPPLSHTDASLASGPPFSDRCGTSASSARACVRRSWSSEWECRRV
jgi:hypothetical protein